MKTSIIIITLSLLLPVLTSCNQHKKEMEAMVNQVDSLTDLAYKKDRIIAEKDRVIAAKTDTINAYKYNPSQLISQIQIALNNKKWSTLESAYQKMVAYHANDPRISQANSIYGQYKQIRQSEAQQQAKIQAAKEERERLENMSVKDKIINGYVKHGMTKQQCRTILGKPDNIDTNEILHWETWYYYTHDVFNRRTSSCYVRFEHGRLKDVNTN